MIDHYELGEERIKQSQSRFSRRETSQNHNDNNGVLSRRALIVSSAGAALTGLAGCNRLPVDEFADTRFSPQQPPTTPTPGTDTPATSEELLPEDFEDGCGTVGPGETVGGRREGIDFRISPIGAQPAAKVVPKAAFQSTAPPVLENLRGITASHRENVFSPVTLQTRPNSGCSFETKQAVGESSQALILNPDSSRVYPGALFTVDSVWRGQMQPVAGDRAPIRISVSLAGPQFEGSAARVVSSPSLSAVRDAMNDILRTVIPGTATRAHMDYEMHSVYGHRQAHVALGAHFDGFGWGFGFDFEDSNEVERSKVIVVFRQNYFTVDVDIPNAFFADGRNPSKEDAVVSSVTYGRLLLFSAESEASEDRVRGALKAAVAGLGSASAESEYGRTINEMTIRVRALGGSGSAATGPIVNGVEGINQYILDGADYSPTSPSFPLSYQLTYLSDFSIAETQMRTEYTQRVCQTHRVLLQDITFSGLDTYDGFLNRNYGLELYGLITVEAVGGVFVGAETPRTLTELPTEHPSTSTSAETVEGTRESPASSEIVLWRVPGGGSDMILLTEEKPHTLPLGTEFEFPATDGTTSPGAGLRFFIELIDYDGGGDDVIGRDQLFIPLSDILSTADEPLTPSIELSENNEVRLEFTIERV